MAGGFEALGLAPELIRAVTEDLGYLLPTNVQDEAIPLILGGGDVMVAAETGSGKTAAFCLPVLQIIHEELRRRSVQRPKLKGRGDAGSDSFGTGYVCQISVVDKDDDISVSPDGLSCQSRSPKWAGARGCTGVGGGIYCYEAKVDDEGLCRFGWAMQRASFSLGTDIYGYGFGGTGMKSHGGQFETYGEAFVKGDRVGCRLDLVKGEVSFSKNGRDLGVAYHLPPGTRGPFFPAVALKNAQASFNFSTAAFHGGIPLASSRPEDMVISSVEIEEEASTGGGEAGDHSVRTPRAIIVEPTRELAEQVADCLTVFKRHFTSPSLEHVLLVGGTDARKATKLVKGSCDVVVGTPGRVLDFVEKGLLKTSAVRLLILDEADSLLKADHQDQLKIYKRLPRHGVGDLRLQVCFFSATLHSPEIAKLSESLCDHPTWVDLKGRDSVPEMVHHVLVRVNPDLDSTNALMRAACQAKTDGAALGMTGEEELRAERLKKIKPQVLLLVIEALKIDQALIFCRTNLDCDLLEQFLTAVGGGYGFSGRRESGKENAFSCCVLAGMRSMDQRRANLQAFKDGDVRFLVCTDVAARGVDIKGLPYVINMTLPDEPENYIHRVGRVGRQDCLGLAVSIAACDGCREKVWYHRNCPNRGRNCFNRNLLAQGGCTIWYDEPSLLKAVETRLKAPIPELGPEYTLPPSLSGIGGGGGTLPEYGGKTSDGGSSVDRARLEEHVQSLKPAVRELAKLEFEAQNSWLAMMQGVF